MIMFVHMQLWARRTWVLGPVLHLVWGVFLVLNVFANFWLTATTSPGFTELNLEVR
jgi:hypothetical protein